MRIGFPFVCVLGMSLSGCPGTTREAVPLPAGSTSEAEEPRTGKVAELGHRADLAAGRVRDGVGQVLYRAQTGLEKVSDADATRLLLVPAVVAGYLVAFFCGHAAPPSFSTGNSTGSSGS